MNSYKSNEITTSIYLHELLDQLGFEMWQSIVNTFILPPINFIGIALCSFSLWIFSRSSFEDPKVWKIVRTKCEIIFLVIRKFPNKPIN